MNNKLKNGQQNGTTKPGMPDVKAPVQLPQPSPAAKQTEPAKPSIEDRIQKVEELRSLTGKRHRTLETLNNLRTFNFGADDSCVLMIQDSQGHKFQTGNSNLVSMLKGYLEATLGDKVSALEDEILNFKI